MSGVDTRLAAGKQRVHGAGIGDHPAELGPHVLAEVRRFHGGTRGAVLQDEGVRLLQPEMGVRENFVGEGMDDDVAREGIIDIVQTVTASTRIQTQRSAERVWFQLIVSECEKT